MRVLMFGLMGIGTGCILPGVSYQESVEIENESSSETGIIDTAQNGETGDPEEQGLDLELSTTVNDGHGLAGMHDWHLIFDGELALERQVTNINSEFNQFLKPDTGWGFAVTIAPYNEDVEKFLFGEGNTNGKQFVLFQTNNAVLSMQFVSVGGGNSDPDSVVPEIQYDIRDPQSKQVCMSKRWKKASGDTFFIPTRQDLFDGFQMLMTYKSQNDGLDAGPTLHLRDDHNGFYVAFDEPETFEFGGCPAELNDEVSKIVFGQGTVLENPENNGVLHHFRGRVDDLLFFKLEKNDFAFGDSGMLADVDLSSVAFDLGTESYLDEPTDDGVAWFPFHKVFDGQATNNGEGQESNQAVDASSMNINQNGFPLSADLCRIDGEDRDCDLTEDLAWTQDHYRKFDQTFEEGMWHEDSGSESQDGFVDNMNSMSGTHLVFDGTYYLQHEASVVPGGATGDPVYGLIENVPFLSYSDDWAFAFKWAPNSQGVYNQMFGTDTLDGEEIMLFKAGNNLVTIQFEKQGAQNQVLPVLRLKTVDINSGAGGFCRDVATPSTGRFNRDELAMGMKMAVEYRFNNGGGADTLRFDLNGNTVFNGTLDLTGGTASLSCVLDNTPGDGMPRIVDFGFDDPDFEPVKGRVDDLLIFMVGVNNNYFQVFNQLAQNDNWGDISASTTGSNKDNVLWWNFDKISPFNILTEAHQQPYSAIEPAPYQWTMIHSPSSSQANAGNVVEPVDAVNYYDGSTGQ